MVRWKRTDVSNGIGGDSQLKCRRLDKWLGKNRFCRWCK
jgi:hypothetical protein